MLTFRAIACAGILMCSDAVTPELPFPDRHSLGLDRSHIARASDGLFYVDGMTGDRHIRFVVDTGANATVLSAADARQAGVAAHRSDVRIRTVSGYERMKRGRIGRLAINGVEVCDVDVVIVDTLVSSLLGMDVLGAIGPVSVYHDHLELPSQLRTSSCVGNPAYRRVAGF